MTTIVSVLHILFAVILITLILLQNSKGGMGSTFGGASSVVSAVGAENILSRLTKFFALAFAATCLGLGYISAKSTKSVLDSVPSASVPAAMPVQETAPAAPVAPAATETAPEAKK